MNWIPNIFRRRKLYNDLSQEIGPHIEGRTEQLIFEGVSFEEAEQQAGVAFGNRTLLEERSREVWPRSTLESIAADVRFALRQNSSWRAVLRSMLHRYKMPSFGFKLPVCILAAFSAFAQSAPTPAPARLRRRLRPAQQAEQGGTNGKFTIDSFRNCYSFLDVKGANVPSPALGFLLCCRFPRCVTWCGRPDITIWTRLPVPDFRPVICCLVSGSHSGPGSRSHDGLPNIAFALAKSLRSTNLYVSIRMFHAVSPLTASRRKWMQVRSSYSRKVAQMISKFIVSAATC
jgi:hypothetical protein